MLQNRTGMRRPGNFYKQKKMQEQQQKSDRIQKEKEMQMKAIRGEQDRVVVRDA